MLGMLPEGNEVPGGQDSHAIDPLLQSRWCFEFGYCKLVVAAASFRPVVIPPKISGIHE